MNPQTSVQKRLCGVAERVLNNGWSFIRRGFKGWKCKETFCWVNLIRSSIPESAKKYLRYDVSWKTFLKPNALIPWLLEIRTISVLSQNEWRPLILRWTWSCIFTDVSDSHWEFLVTQIPKEDLDLDVLVQRHEHCSFLTRTSNRSQKHFRIIEKITWFSILYSNMAWNRFLKNLLSGSIYFSRWKHKKDIRSMSWNFDTLLWNGVSSYGFLLKRLKKSRRKSKKILI